MRSKGGMAHKQGKQKTQMLPPCIHPSPALSPFTTFSPPPIHSLTFHQTSTTTQNPTPQPMCLFYILIKAPNPNIALPSTMTITTQPPPVLQIPLPALNLANKNIAKKGADVEMEQPVRSVQSPRSRSTSLFFIPFQRPRDRTLALAVH